MSDARTQAIHKAAAELVQELLAASGENGGERWFHIIVRKMEQVPDRCPPKKPNTKMPLVLNNTRFVCTSLGLTMSNIYRERRADGHYVSAEQDSDVAFISAVDLPKLKLWLNGE